MKGANGSFICHFEILIITCAVLQVPVIELFLAWASLWNLSHVVALSSAGLQTAVARRRRFFFLAEHTQRATARQPSNIV